jgi:hypothetical protein
MTSTIIIDVTKMTNRERKRVWFNLKNVGRIKKVNENGKKLYIVECRSSHSS